MQLADRQQFSKTVLSQHHFLNYESHFVLVRVISCLLPGKTEDNHENLRPIFIPPEFRTWHFQYEV